MPFEQKKRVVSKKLDYTLTAADHNSVIIAAGGADIEFTLPAVAGAKDMVVDFINAVDYEMLITAPDETMVLLNDATADAVSYTTATEHIGASCRCICDGVLWYVQNLSAGANTVTVVSA